LESRHHGTLETLGKKGSVEVTLKRRVYDLEQAAESDH